MNLEYVEDFLETIAAEKGAAGNTVSSYLFDLNQLNEYFQAKSVEEISAKDLQNFLHYLKSRGYSYRSVCRKLSSLRDFFKFLLSENIIKDNPAINLESPKKEKTLPDFLSQDEILKIINTAICSDKFIFRRNGAMIALMYVSGLRVSELLSLTMSSINFEKALVFVKGKGSKERLVPIAGSALDIITEYIKEREFFLKNRKSNYLFPSAKNPSETLTRDVFFRQLKSLASNAGINPEKVHPHILRHSFATFLINENVDLRSVQKMLGHENIMTTEIYTHILSDNLKETVKKNHPLSKL